MDVGEIRALLAGLEDEQRLRVSLTAGDFRALLAGLPDDVPVLPTNQSIPSAVHPPARPATVFPGETCRWPWLDAETAELEWFETVEEASPHHVEEPGQNRHTGARCTVCDWRSDEQWTMWSGTPSDAHACPHCGSKMLIFLHHRSGGADPDLL